MKSLTFVVASFLVVSASTFAACDGGVRAVVPLRDDAGAGAGDETSSEAGSSSLEPTAGAAGTNDVAEGGSAGSAEAGAPAGGTSP